jgi:hypothetical protein
MLLSTVSQKNDISIATLKYRGFLLWLLHATLNSGQLEVCTCAYEVMAKPNHRLMLRNCKNLPQRGQIYITIMRMY